MSIGGYEKRAQALAIRCYRLRQAGMTLSEVARETGLTKDKVRARLDLGARLAELSGNP